MNTKKCLRPFEVTIPDAEGKRVAQRIPIKVPMVWDSEVREWLLTPKAEEIIDTVKARHMGLLPDELRRLRERHGLTQRAIGELLQIGAKSWTRWETGKQRPSRSLNLLLVALDRGLISPLQLKELGNPQRDWSAQFTNNQQAGPVSQPVVIDLCRLAQVNGRAASSGYVEPLDVAS
jgi:transcriptional regulator with XRE-family HTH domain